MKSLKSPVVLACLVVLMLSIGTATAAKEMITGKDIANKSITGADIKRKSLPLSVLRTQPVAGKGQAGERGPAGEPGLTGEVGSKGASAITFTVPLSGEIPTIAPSPDLQFVGEPLEETFVAGDVGTISVTVTIGTSGAEIDDREDFKLSICSASPAEPAQLSPIEQEDPGDDFGVSPVLQTGIRAAVPLGTGFSATGTEGAAFKALVGPCVLNDTSSALDESDRVIGYVMVSAL